MDRYLRDARTRRQARFTRAREPDMGASLRAVLMWMERARLETLRRMLAATRITITARRYLMDRTTRSGDPTFNNQRMQCGYCAVTNPMGAFRGGCPACPRRRVRVKNAQGKRLDVGFNQRHRRYNYQPPHQDSDDEIVYR